MSIETKNIKIEGKRLLKVTILCSNFINEQVEKEFSELDQLGKFEVFCAVLIYLHRKLDNFLDEQGIAVDGKVIYHEDKEKI